MEEKHVPNVESPIKFQGATANETICKDCTFRDKTVVEIGQKTIPVGVTRSYCQIYTKKISNGKPLPILFNGADCEYYVKDDS